MSRQRSHPDQFPAPPECVFVLGVTHRSGTNLLVNLLALHPHCDVHAIPEDFLTSELAQLAQFSRKVASHWNPEWGNPDTTTGMEEEIGNGLLNYIARNIQRDEPDARGPAERRVIATKTPSVAGLAKFRRFFPDTYLVIVVRDGRSVVESGMRSFGWDFSAACKRWAGAAREIRLFGKHDTNPAKTLIVKYEDLIENRAAVARSLFALAGLDDALVSEEKLRGLPVTGSSDLVNTGAQKVHWEPTPAQAEFQPLERFANWTDRKHARFNSIAGEEMERLGYVLKSVGAATVLLTGLLYAFDVRRIAPRKLLRRLLPRS